MDSNTVILLDIDGVLNEPQQPITFCMRQKLESLARSHLVYFVTGNNYIKSIDILNGSIAMFSGIFVNNGDELRSMRGKLIWSDKETPALPRNLERTLKNVYKPEAANCIEWRNPKFLNFSKIGRFASREERLSHDASWRDDAAEFIRFMYPEVEVSKGGAVSIDIYSKGADKSRAAKWINAQGRDFLFIGDKTDIAGNDYPIKKYCDDNSKNICWTSKGVVNTMGILDRLLGNT